MYTDLEKSEASEDTNITFPSVPSGGNGHPFVFGVFSFGILRNCVFGMHGVEVLVFLWVPDRKGSICVWHLNYVRSAVLKMCITLGIT